MLHESSYPVAHKKPAIKPLTNERFSVLFGKVINRLLTTPDRLQNNNPELYPIVRVVTTETGPNNNYSPKPHHDLRGLTHPHLVKGFIIFIDGILQELNYGLERQNDSQLVKTYLQLANNSTNPYWLEEKLKNTSDIQLYSRVTVAILEDVKRELQRHVGEHPWK